MANPLFNRFGGQRNSGVANSRFSNMSSMLKQFNDFKANFKGDPKQQVQNLISSGQMTMEQFNQLEELAKQFQSFMNGK